MTVSKITFAVLAFGLSFGPALAESGEVDHRSTTAPFADAMAAPIRGVAPSAMMFRELITPSQQVVIDRNDPRHQSR